MTAELKISEDRRLNDVVLEMLEKVAVRDIDTGREIPGLTKQGFLLSAPYRIREKEELLARTTGFGRAIFDPGFSDGLGLMTTERVISYACRFISYTCGFTSGGLSNNVSLDFMEVKTAIYKQPKLSLEGGLPLNAFEVRGVIYRLNG